ncbi:MAG: polymer-forming cytoskeletal protein [Elusimicrobia bacterium]|nr:polymer-forming cytoskeletal protein [Elusimicrobiota bacterium]
MEKHSGDVVSVIGAEAYFQGALTVKGSIRVDGRVEGAVSQAQSVVVGKTGKVDGDISADNVVISGEVAGNVSARESLELLSTSKVSGDISAPKILIEKGAFFNGKCSMSGEEQI